MRIVVSSQFTVNSGSTKRLKSGKRLDGDFNTADTESTEEEREESVRDEARGEGRLIEAVG
jgi:hypothetical protein